MAAGAGFKTFATGDVLTAADTNSYLMQGIWVFASATARDAAVTSPQEGNACYLKDTDVVQTYSGSAWVAVSGSASPLTTKGDVWGYSTTNARIPIGTDGQILTADSTAALGLKWATTAAASSDWVKIETLSPSAAATATFSNSVFSSTYKFYQLRLHLTQTGSSNITMQARSGGSTLTTSIYQRGLFVQKMDSGNGTVALGASNQTSWLLGYADGGNAFEATVNFYGTPATSSSLRGGMTFQYQGVDSAFATIATGFGGLAINSSNAFDSLIVSASSNMTGTISLYGLKG